MLRRMVGAARRMQTAVIETSLGIDTVTPPSASSAVKTTFGDGREYEAVHYGLFRHFIAPLGPTQDDVVFDVGCGLGRTLCVFARMGVKECVGIEISPELAEGARENARRLRGGSSPITIRVEDAATADYSRGTIYVFFNPFGERTLSAAVERIREDVAKDPRRIRVLYLNPIDEHVLKSSGWLRFKGRKGTSMSRLTASYWTNDLS